MITLAQEMKGFILDIGGGGEGIIGRVYGHQVTAIDKCQDELDEAPGGYQKIPKRKNRNSVNDSVPNAEYMRIYREIDNKLSL